MIRDMFLYGSMQYLYHFRSGILHSFHLKHYTDLNRRPRTRAGFLHYCLRTPFPASLRYFATHNYL